MKENNENEKLKVPNLNKETEHEENGTGSNANGDFVKMPTFSSGPKPWDKYIDGEKPAENDSEVDFDDSEEIESYLSKSVSRVTDEDMEDDYDNEWEEERPKMSRKKKIIMGISLGLGVILLLILGAGAFMINQLRDKDTQRAATDLTPEELAAQQTLAPRPSAQLELDSKVINILLIGEEAIGENGEGRGRSDSMIIVSMNTEQKTLKMVSVMRDCYVSIPGYRDNKLNAAYNNGGGPLVMDTIEQNFGVQLDGYVRVNFEAFRKVINKIGGVEVTLTEDEARYLNTTNYISKKKNRCVKAGTQTLNGDQALGYCRVRYRSAGNGEANDFGRTYRQRVVLSSIFEKVKDMSAVDIAGMVTELFPYVQTDVLEKDVLTYATAALSIGAKEVQSMRIPLDNAYTGGKVYCGAVLLLDFPTNNKALQEFIYGTALGEVMTIQPQDSYEVGTGTYTPATNSTTTTTYAPTVTQRVYATRRPVYTYAPKQTEAPKETQTVVQKTGEPSANTKAPAKTQVPAPAKTKAPAKTQAPAPAKTQAPAPAKTQAPAPVMTDTPSDNIEPVGNEE